MTDYSAIRNKLLAKQQELSSRVKATQATEGHEVEQGQDSNAQLWEDSEIRDVNSGTGTLFSGDFRQHLLALERERSRR